MAMIGLPGLKRRQVNNDLHEANESSMDMQSFRVKYRISDTMSVSSVSAHSLFKQVTRSDMDGSPYDMMWSDTDSQYEKFSEELRFNYERDRLKFVAGLYIDDEDNEPDYLLQLYDESMGTFLPTHRNTTGNAYAAFFNLTYPVLEKVNLVGGLRLERQEYEMEDHIAGFKTDDSWDSRTRKFSVEYLLSPETMFYVTAAQGYRSGGFNSFGTASSFASNPCLQSYDEEKLWNYELGMKSSFLDNRLLVNAAVYWLDVSDMQVNTRMSPYETYLSNVADAQGFGAELELRAKPNAKTTVDVILNFKHGQDNISLDKSFFTKLKKTGKLNAANFRKNATATARPPPCGSPPCTTSRTTSRPRISSW